MGSTPSFGPRPAPIAPSCAPPPPPPAQARTQEGGLGSSNPAHTAAFKGSYDPAAYAGDACEPWCAGDVFIDVAKATAKGRKKFPPTRPGEPGPVASEEEKCSWDNMCGGCGGAPPPLLTVVYPLPPAGAAAAASAREAIHPLPSSQW